MKARTPARTYEMNERILNKTYEITKSILTSEYPQELEAFNLIWPKARAKLSQWLERDPDDWSLNKDDRTSLSLGFFSPEAQRIINLQILLIFAAVIARLIEADLFEADDIRQFMIQNIKKYGRKLSVPRYVVRHLQNTLPGVLTEIPDDLAETEKCYRILPKGKPESITIKQARELRPQYKVCIDLQQDLLRLYVAGKPLRIDQKPIRVLLNLLRANGKVATYEEIFENAWGELPESNPNMTYISRIERAINQNLKTKHDLFRENIINEARKGYRIKGELLNYCLIIGTHPSSPYVTSLLNEISGIRS